MASVGDKAGSVNRTVTRTWRVIPETTQTVRHLGLVSEAEPRLVEVRVAGPGGQAYLTAVFEVPVDWLEDGRWESDFANWEGRLGPCLTALSVLKQYDQLVEGGRASSRRRRAIWRYIEEYVEREPGAGWRRIWRSLPEERASASEVELEDGSMYQVYREGKGDREGDRAVQVPLDGGPPSDLARETFRKYFGRISRSRR